MYENILWTIMPRLRSTTVAINSEICDQLMDEFCAWYGPSDDRGTTGQFYRCHMKTGATVTNTCYATTHNISVQELLHDLWIENVLREIQHKITSVSPDSNQNKSICIQPTISTHQRNSASLPCFDLNATTSIISHCPSTRTVELQTGDTPVCVSVGIQTTVTCVSAQCDEPSKPAPRLWKTAVTCPTNCESRIYS